MLNQHAEEDGEMKLFAAVSDVEGEVVISRAAESRYIGGLTKSWRKLNCGAWPAVQRRRSETWNALSSVDLCLP
jgi:hypothetical protein